MAVLRKILQKQDLSSIETYVNDTTFNSKYFNVLSVEDTIPGGKSSFQILGSKYLTPDVELRVELLDKNGNPVYTEAIKYLGDKPSRHISIEVYENTPAGVGTLTILGSAEFLSGGDSISRTIPEEWRNLYNVKWERNVYIDPREKNTQPILFQGQAVGFKEFDRYQLPSLDISEQVRGIIVPSGSGGTTPTGFVTQSLFTGGNYEANASPFGKPSDVKDAPTEDDNGNPFPKADAEVIPSTTTYNQKPKNQAVDNPIETFTNSDTIYKSIHGIGNGLTVPPEIEEIHPSEPEESVEPNFTGQGTLVKKTSGDPFRAEFEGGIFKAVPSVNHNLVKNITGKTYTSSSFTASIIAVHSPELIEIDRPFTIQNQTEYPDRNFKVPHKATSFTIDYEPAGQTQNSGSGESTVVFRSFAEITVKNMKTFSGDVHRIKTYTKGFSEAGEFSLIADRLVDASDILNDRSSPSLRQKTGVFQTQGHLDKNWTLTRVIKGKNVTGISTSGSLSFTSTSTPAFMNGVIISGSNGMADETIVLETKTSDLRVRPDVDYELKLRAILKVGEKDVLQSDGTTLQQAKGKVRFYLSGSRIEQDLKGIQLGGAKNNFGDPVRFNVVKDENFGEVVALQSNDSNNSVGELIDFGIIRIPFKPNFENDVVVNDDTKLQIEVESGQLYLQRVELLPATETNFSPDEFTFVAPMPKLRTRPDIFDFRVEFYDRNANKAEYSTIKEAVTFEGQNEVIQGTDNLLTGSLFIGNALLSGIEAGGLNSAFIRSVGYVGFTSASSQGSGGFMMWSGSVLPDSPDNYEGVGLEIHDGNSGSFKFRTHNADGVGEFDVRTNKFFFGKAGSQFISGSDNKIEISSSNFHIKPDGNVTASSIFLSGDGETRIAGNTVIESSVTIQGSVSANSILVPAGANANTALAQIRDDGYARFTTGSIASFTIDSNAISTTGSNSFYISGSAGGIPTQDGAQNQFISASKFQVSALGDLTASNVLIEGGTITSDVNILGTVAANQILTPAGSTTTNAKASITAAGAARFTSASIAGFRFSETSISSSNGSLILRDNGRITGSLVKFEGGDIGGFDITTTYLGKVPKFRISSSTDTEDPVSFISSSAFKVSAGGQITGSNVLFTGGTIAGWTINGTTFQDADAKVRLNAGNAKITINSHTFGNAGIQLDYNSGTPRFYVGDGSSDYIKYVHGTGVDIKSAIFDLDATTLILDSATNNGTIRLGASGGPSAVGATTAGIYMDGNGDFLVYGDADNFLRFDISDKLEIKAETFDLATSTLVIDSSTNSGKIALGATPNSNISGTNKGVYLDGQGDFLLYGSATNYFKFDASSTSIDIKTDTFDLATSTMILDSGTNSGKIALGSSLNTSVAGTSQGIYMDGTGDFLIRGDANNFLKMDGTTFTIKSEIFALDTTNLDIDSASKRITINDGSADRIYIGEVDGGTTYGMKIFDGTGTADSDIIVEFGEGQNYIAGWTVGTDTISSNNLVLHSSGRIETSNFASGLRGWRIDSLQNGIAEFENARIRGTLSTTVFEKETINAVGGQLYVANSTMLTSSTHHPQGTVSASNATMSVVNVTGFTGSFEGGPGHSGNGKGEILAIKKVTDTGFSTEYVQVVSHSRLNPSSGTDLSGLLFVTRSYGAGIDETGTGLSSSLGDPAFTTAQQYEPGQVIVSTGRHIGGTGSFTTGSGFVRINANPNDLSTPFIDIVERTGSAIYDVDLKVRLGDLSGLSSQYVRGADVKGFGLVTSNVFLTSSFFVGGVNEHISFQTGSFEAKLKKLNLSTGQGLTIQGEGSGSANKVMLGLASAFGTGDGVFMDGGGDFRVGGASSNYVKFDASTGTLTVDGTINITGGATSEAIAGLQATTTSSNAQSQSAMLGFASESNARSDASASIVSGGLGGKIDPYETQVVLSSGGMSLRKTEGQILAEYNESINLRAPDATTKNTASLDTNGFRIVEGGVTQSLFGQITTIGVVTGSHLRASGSGLELLNNTTTRFGADSTGVSVGDPANEHVRITTSGLDLKDGTTTYGRFASTTTIGNTSTEHIQISGSGLELLDGSTKRFGIDSTGVNIGDPANEHARITTSGVELKDGATTYGNFASTTTIGDTSTEHISISNTELRLKDGSTTRILMNSSGLTMGNHISINASGDASFSGTVTVGGTDLTTANTLNANTTAANVGLGNVDNTDSQGTAQAGLISGTTITGGGITLSGGGSIKSTGKDSLTDTTAGFFLGHDGSSGYDFAIGDASQYLKYDGSAGTLTLAGSITITNPGDIDISDITNDMGLTKTFRQASAPTALTVGDLWYDTDDGNKLYRASAIGASNWVATVDGTIATAQSTANTAETNAQTGISNAATAQTQANTATTNAATAQTAIDLMETRVVIDNTGMALKAKSDAGSGTLNGQTLAEYGTTTTLYDGVAHATANKKLEMDASGITLWGGAATGNDYINLAAGSLGMYSNNVRTLHITDHGINIGKSAVGPSSDGATSAVIGNISLHSAGAHIYGAATDDYVNIKSDGVDVVTAGDKVASFGSTITLAPDVSAATTDSVVIEAGGIKIYDTSTDYIHISSDGLKVYDGDASNAVAQFGATTYVGLQANEHIKITNSSFEIKDGSTVFGSFGATTKIGDANNEHVEINTSTIDVKDGSDTLSSFGATTTIGQTSGRHISIDSTDVRVKQGSTVKSIFGASSITLGHNSTTDEHIIIDSDGLNVKDGGTSLAQFGSTATIFGGSTADKLVVNSDGVEITENSQVRAIFGSTSVIGSSGAAVTTTSTDDCIRIAAGSVTMFQDTNNKAVVNSSGLAVTQGGVDVASFGSTVRVGPDANSKSRVEISSGAVNIINKDSSGDETTVISFDSSGDIDSGEFLIERTRLFGAGGDGTVVLEHDDCAVSATSGSAAKVSNASIRDENGTTVCTRSGTTWTMKGDWYTKNLTLDYVDSTAVTLVTNGYRLFVQDTLTVDANNIIHNDGSDGGDGTNGDQSSAKTGGTAGAGGGESGCSLSPGPDGGAGGNGSTNSGGHYGGSGGAGGGAGGIIFIAARTIANSGTIRSAGGDGGDGGDGSANGSADVGEAAVSAGSAGSAGSVIHIKI